MRSKQLTTLAGIIKKFKACSGEELDFIFLGYKAMCLELVLFMTSCSSEDTGLYLVKRQAFLINWKGLFFDMRIFLIIISFSVEFLIYSFTITTDKVLSYSCGWNIAFNFKDGPKSRA
ncbi:hypothetical protein V4P56_02715 [Bartonella sp. B35(2025)]